MSPKLSKYRHFFLMLILLALPALACGPFSGSDETDESTIALDASAEEAVSELGQSAEDAASSVATSVAATLSASEPVGAADSTASSPTEDSIAGAQAQDSSNGPNSSASTDEEALAIIAEAFRTGLAIDSVRIAMTNTFLDTDQTDSVIIEFIRPDRFHMVSNDMELIIIEDKTYINSGDGTWIESPVGMNEIITPMLDSFLDETVVEEMVTDLENDAGTYQYLGEESLDGIQTRVYEFTSPPTVSDTPDRVTIWIGVNDGRIYRQEIESSETEGGILAVLEYRYDEDVVIEAPIP